MFVQGFGRRFSYCTTACAMHAYACHVLWAWSNECGPRSIPTCPCTQCGSTLTILTTPLPPLHHYARVRHSADTSVITFTMITAPELFIATHHSSGNFREITFNREWHHAGRKLQRRHSQTPASFYLFFSQHQQYVFQNTTFQPGPGCPRHFQVTSKFVFGQKQTCRCL